jgi:hypothetical protein
LLRLWLQQNLADSPAPDPQHVFFFFFFLLLLKEITINPLLTRVIYELFQKFSLLYLHVLKSVLKKLMALYLLASQSMTVCGNLLNKGAQLSKQK